MKPLRVRFTVRRMMVAVAIAAFLLPTRDGLRNRAKRFEALALEYGREANRLEVEWRKSAPLPPGEPDLLCDDVHWNDSVADAYRRAASRPWLPFEPNPGSITCGCGYHRKQSAGTAR
jgi:hypothetical protein